MYDKKGKALKQLDVEKLEKVNGYWIPKVNYMKNLQTGHATRLSIQKLEIDKPISSRVFTPQFLSTGRAN